MRENNIQSIVRKKRKKPERRVLSKRIYLTGTLAHPGLEKVCNRYNIYTNIPEDGVSFVQ